MKFYFIFVILFYLFNFFFKKNKKSILGDASLILVVKHFKMDTTNTF